MKRIFLCAIYRVVTYMIYLGCDNNQDISTSHHLSFVIQYMLDFYPHNHQLLTEIESWKLTLHFRLIINGSNRSVRRLEPLSS
jgi:hypothetical protein